jgi:hypothetical protein
MNDKGIKFFLKHPTGMRPKWGAIALAPPSPNQSKKKFYVSYPVAEMCY